MGRQKIEIKKIENEDARLVSFSKRRTGLFNKASCLSTLCGADVAVVVFSPAGTPYSFGSPRVDQVLTRFLSGGKEPVEPAIMRQNHVAAVQELSRQCMELESRVEAFQTKRRELEERLRAAPPVRDEPNGMGLEELQGFMDSLRRLKEMTDGCIREELMRGGDAAAFTNLTRIQGLMGEAHADEASSSAAPPMGPTGFGSYDFGPS
ncbi:hypothetical protein HPP92_018216 [Vanilla planifolia]|uniref:MADS-box domain-containing protein n=1 Tax=Vanilla planifolia TaxID=51239 RepID=A0A835QHL8_VANPL|nr:hypothetical protein HPP92_018216 [Vanilla planifolia]